MNPAGIGAAIGALFGGLWGFAAASQLGGRWTVPLQLVSIGITVLIVGALLIRGAGAGNGTRFKGGIYLTAVALEAVAIVVALNMLAAYHLQQAIGPVTGFLVGLHFIGLWLATGARIFVLITLGCCLVCAASLLALPFPATAIAAGFGMAIVLWGATAATVRR